MYLIFKGWSFVLKYTYINQKNSLWVNGTKIRKAEGFLNKNFEKKNIKLKEIFSALIKHKNFSYKNHLI